MSTHNIYFYGEIFSDVAAHTYSLLKHAYSNIFKISQPKPESLQIKILIFFYISAQNIDCGYLLECLTEAVLMSTHNLCF